MEENKLFNQIKSAADNAETKDFPGMEKVWQRLEDKLDTKEDKKQIGRWKKIAVAASLLLFATLGYQFFKKDPDIIKPNEVVTAKDSIKKPSQETIQVATAEPKSPAIKHNAEQILKEQINSANQAAVVVAEADMPSMQAAPSVAPTEYDVEPAKYKFGSEEVAAKRNLGLLNNASIGTLGFSNDSSTLTFKESKKANDVELFMNKDGKVSNAKKEEPLVLMEDKVVKKKLENIEFNTADSLVVLKEPLYIINGVEFTEQEVFGPNPTSPYTPLNKQDIESVSILQGEKAIEFYGDKGKKGVVIITTKTRKPASASTKAK